MSAKGRQRTPEERERISRGLRRWNAQRRARGAVVDADLRALTRGEADCRPALRPYIAAGVAEAEAIVTALGGSADLSPQKLALLRDVARLGAVIGAVTAAFFRSEDHELIPKLTSAIAARRALLERLGLDERRVEKSLDEYLAERARAKPQNRAGSTIEATAVCEPAPDAESEGSP